MALLDLLVLLAVAALWGASFLFIRQASPVLGPVALIEARVTLAGLALLAVAVLARKLPDFRRDLWGFLVLGGLSAAIPFTLIATAELRIGAALAAILNATTPMFALCASAARHRRLPSLRQLAGVLVGVAGVTVVVGLGPLRLTGAVLLAATASLLAAFSYALGGVYVKARFPRTNPLVTVTGQQLGAAVWLLIPCIALPPRHGAGGAVILAVLALALACTALGFGLFFRLVATVGPTGALTVTFLVPVFGLLWGTVFLGERLSWSVLLGLALVLGAVILVTDIQRGGTRDGRGAGRAGGAGDAGAATSAGNAVTVAGERRRRPERGHGREPGEPGVRCRQDCGE